MRTIDFTPVFRSTVGFDRMARLMDDMMRAGDAANVPAYPPYNIEKLGEDDYRITMAVAGFGEGDLDITVEDTTLVISGKVEKTEEEANRSFLHRGIATRAFERRFQLAETIKVVGASVEHGLLHVDLVHEVPEEKKPRKVEIASGVSTKRLEGTQAA
ncbi:Hsp20 family protein [Thalassobaculum litoreum]|uniref:Molecular chaperone IbpA n=1 Tax=Thalassobaculum litoreum DSM 18839 TaxID=1123362 RepID=A0A8G2BES4_9PROT|nr:Hsp20 family protein [Thalassobaculum litoreum]SDF24736.1 molecular chaperone IbpA [Thalassobaculum litoreum DSM 18839]